MWKARIFTLYPEIFPGPLNKGLYGKALSNKIWNLDIINIRDSAKDKHKTVDDTPFGGGSGMLIKPDVLARSIDQHINKSEKIFYLSPKGKLFNQEMKIIQKGGWRGECRMQKSRFRRDLRPPATKKKPSAQKNSVTLASTKTNALT